MTSFTQLLGITLPVFALFAFGLLLRWRQWLTEEGETSLLKVIFGLLYPCLILRSVLCNAALREPANLASALFLGFAMLSLGIGVSYYVGRALGLSKGKGLRTFAFAAGISNYGYIPIPLIQALWGSEHVGVLLVFNTGAELAVWTIGVLLLAGQPFREGWRRAVNPVVLTLFAGVVLNLFHFKLPHMALTIVDALGNCVVPLGLLMAGSTIVPFLKNPRELANGRVIAGGCLLRLGALPLVLLALAKWLPCSLELKRVLVIQAAMPAGMLPLVIARHYGGQPLTAAQIILSTTLLALFLIPLWIVFGLSWVGVG